MQNQNRGSVCRSTVRWRVSRLVWRSHHLAVWARAWLWAIGLSAAWPVAAQSPVTPPQEPAAVVKTAVEKWLRGRYPVEAVRKSPVAGLWEVQIGTDLFYVDEKGQYGLVEGHLIEFRSNRNLTQERIDDLLTIDFKTLPLALAIKQVQGKGTRQVAVFEDPNCGYCRTLRRDLMNAKDVTVYTFTLPILGAESGQLVRQVWCAPDRAKAWNDWMLNRRLPNNPGTCDTPVEKITELGRKLKVTGTPTLVFASGKRVPGGVPAARLTELLEEHGKPL